jgi:hypothetical protein
LLLDLVIHRQGGIQGHIAWFEKLTFKMRSSGNAYDEVDILHGGNVVQRVKVEHPLTFAAPPVKKPPAKKAPVKEAPLQKKPAKAAAAKKKTAKKAAKKPAKKAANKGAKNVAKKKSTKKK